VVQGEAASEKRFVGEVVRRLEERGVDVNDRSKRPLQGGPQGSARLRLDLAERFLAKAEEYVRKGTPFRRRRRATGPPRRSLRPWPRRPVGRSWAASGLAC